MSVPRELELAEHGLTIGVPEGWEALEPPTHVALVLADSAPASGDPDGFRPNVTVVVTPPDTQDVERIRAETAAGLADALVSMRLLDSEDVAIDGHAGARLLAAHVVEHESVTLDQVVVPFEHASVAISASCASCDYPAFADLFATVAGSVRKT
jgi:hypothetical protein